MSPQPGIPEAAALPRGRLWIALVVLGLGLGVIVVKAGRLQLDLGEDLRELAEQQYLRTLRFSAPRGNVYDRVGRPLAVSVPVWSVSAAPRVVDDPAAVAARLGPVLEMDVALLEEKLATRRAFLWLRRRVAPEMAEAVQALDVDGIALHRESKRFYPGRHLAGQLLGTVSIDGQGQSGVERNFDEHLRGRAVALPGLRDNRGRKLLLGGSVDLEVLGGDDVYLTLDARVQHAVEQALVRGIESTGAKSGFAVVVEPRTGAIRAVANAPLANPNEPGEGPAQARRNRAFSDVFEPGSTFKIMTFAAALEAGTAQLGDRYFCENGRYRLGRFTVRDTHPAGWLTFREVFKESSNICSLKIGQKVGEERLRATIEAFGFGGVTGTGFVEESTGLMPRGARWGEVRTATVSYGHGISVTALQLAQALSVVANDGQRVPLRLLERVQAASGEIAKEPAPVEPVVVLRPEIAETLTGIMTSIFEEGGTGARARLDGVEAAGKTGTAEKVDPHTGRYSSERNTSSFVGFAPADDPRVVAVVVLDEPMVMTSGGATAGPIWKEIVTAALVDEGVLTAQALSGTSLQGEARVGATGAASSDAAIPARPPSSLRPKGEARFAPFLGLSVREALRKAAELGVDVQLDGTGVVVAATELEVEPGAEPRVLLSLATPGGTAP